MHFIQLRTVLALSALLAPFAPAFAQGARVLNDEQLQPIAKALAELREARRESRDQGAALASLRAGLASARSAPNGVDLIAQPADLERALWLASDYQTRKLRPGKVVGDEFKGGVFAAQGLEYALRLPKDYDPQVRAYPLILAIPEDGRTPADHLRDDWTESELQDNAILIAPQMPKGDGDWAQVTIGGKPGGLSHVLTALRIATEAFAVDSERIYVAGSGRGVEAALAAGNYSPQRFAGIVARAGDASEMSHHNFSNLPTYFSGGGARARAFQEATEAAGFDNSTLEPESSLKDIWTWMLAHPRKKSPSELTLAIGTPFPTRVYWLRIAPIASDARARASIERDKNLIRVEGGGFSHATLYLNDRLVNLTQPVTVICNGVSKTATLQRHLSTTLSLIQDGTSDAGCVYVTQVVFDLAAETMTGVGPANIELDEEYEKRLAAADSNPDELWNLHLWCLANDRSEASRACLRRLLRADSNHARAHQALGHHESGGIWFTSEADMRVYERSQDASTAAARGQMGHKGVWMHRDDRAQASKGRVKDPETGQWLANAERKRLDSGWVRQDMEWIEPRDAAFVDRGLWKVDGEWLTLDVANRMHASVDRMWCIPTLEVTLYTTVDREVALRAIAAMQRAFDEMRRVFGAQPVLPLRVGLLRDEEQYDRYASGDPDGGLAAKHAGREHVIHQAFFAESWFPLENGKRTFGGMGVGIWDSWVPGGDLYGVHSARLAAALSYVHALDPSPKAIREGISKGPGPEYYAAYQAEHQLPDWLRNGGAVYAERYFHDGTVAQDGDPWWPRQWSLDNLHRKGDMRPLEEIFLFPLNPDDAEDGQKLLLEAGLVVAFILDGQCAPVMAAHEDLKSALVGNTFHPNKIAALTKALGEHLSELRAFAGY